VLSFLDSFFNWLEHYSGSPWFYVVIFSIALLDSVVPLVPSESLVIIGGVSAGLHQLHWSLVIVAAAAGAFAGDNISYQIGNRFSTSMAANYSSLGALFQVDAHFLLSVVASPTKTVVGS
jgi:membrane protein DedA with SNARE-associated domain